MDEWSVEAGRAATESTVRTNATNFMNQHQWMDFLSNDLDFHTDKRMVENASCGFNE